MSSPEGIEPARCVGHRVDADLADRGSDDRRLQPSSGTRQRILEAALRVIGEHGLPGLTNRRVAAAAGMSLGSLTYHFSSQQEMLREALVTFAERETARIATVAAAHRSDALSDAAAAAERTLEAVAFGPESIGVLELYLHAARDPSYRDVAHRCWESYDRIARRILAGLGVAEPDRAAPAVVSLVAGTQLRWLATGSHRPGELAGGLAGLLAGVGSHPDATPAS